MFLTSKKFWTSQIFGRQQVLDVKKFWTSKTFLDVQKVLDVQKIFGRPTIENKRCPLAIEIMNSATNTVAFGHFCGRSNGLAGQLQSRKPENPKIRPDVRPGVRPDVRPDGRRRRACRQRRRKKNHLIEAAPFGRLDQMWRTTV